MSLLAKLVLIFYTGLDTVWAFRDACCISSRLRNLIAFYNAPCLLHSFMGLHQLVKMRSAYVSKFFFRFQNRVCVNVEGYNSTESVTLDQWLSLCVWGSYESHSGDIWCYLETCLIELSAWMGTGYWHVWIKANIAANHLRAHRKASQKKGLPGPTW